MAELDVTQVGSYAEIEGVQISVTQVGAYAEIEKNELRVTLVGAYLELEKNELRVTVVGAYVELEPLPPASALDASLVTFLRVQAAAQSGFDSPAEPTFALPVVFEYADAQSEQVAVWDSGAWTPTTIVEQTARYATFTLRGALFFELLPLLFNAGFADDAPSVVEGLPGSAAYVYAVTPATPGDPAPYTFRFGGNDANRSQGSMVQVQDAYMSKLTLMFDLNTLMVTFVSEWFGRFVGDNGGAGYAPMPVTLPPDMEMVNGLLSTLGIVDAGGAPGSEFDVVPFECSLMEWQLAIDTGLRPAWASDGNTLTYCGVRHEMPSATFAAHLRTNLTNYAVTKVKANYRIFQEMRLDFHGTNFRRMRFDMSGRFLPNFKAHDRGREEVIMKPVFSVETAVDSTTGHWLTADVIGYWSGA